MSISGPALSTPPPKPRCKPSLRSIAERNALATANTGLVGVTLERYFPGIPAAARDDAFQSGLLGLLRAAELFDPARGFAFSTYAVRWIRQAIGRSGDERHLIHLPQHLRGFKRQQFRERERVRQIQERALERARLLMGA